MRTCCLLLALLVAVPSSHGVFFDLVTAWLDKMGIHYVPPVSPTVATTTTTTTAPPTCKCGIEGTTRIAGGVETTNGKYPWLIAMNFGTTDGSTPGGCGATLVAANWAVTAAHCVLENRACGRACGSAANCTKDTMSVVLGEHDLSSCTDSGDTKRKNVRLAIDPIVHGSYGSPARYSNDIALLKLAESVDLATYTPACLPTVNAAYTGKTGTVYGWGTINPCATSIETIAREVDISIVSDTTCEAATSTSANGCVFGLPLTVSLQVAINITAIYDISDDMVCAGSIGKGSCPGDSGGPLTVKDSITRQHDLVGVVSWGSRCQLDDLYDVYAEVAKLRDWIDTKIAANGGATYCK